MASPLWYFAYGSNLCGAIFRDRRQLTAQECRVGRLAGYRLCFDLAIGSGERGVANLQLDPNSHVWGALYLLDSDQCEHLDRTEGVPNGIYQRLWVEVTDTNGDAYEAYTYESSLRRPNRRPSPRYMGLILTGAGEHRLPPEYLDFLRTFDLAVDERSDSPG